MKLSLRKFVIDYNYSVIMVVNYVWKLFWRQDVGSECSCPSTGRFCLQGQRFGRTILGALHQHTESRFCINGVSKQACQKETCRPYSGYRNQSAFASSTEVPQGTLIEPRWGCLVACVSSRVRQLSHQLLILERHPFGLQVFSEGLQKELARHQTAGKCLPLKTVGETYFQRGVVCRQGKLCREACLRPESQSSHHDRELSATDCCLAASDISRSHESNKLLRNAYQGAVQDRIPWGGVRIVDFQTHYKQAQS
jgi:hypothetical protein